MVEQQAEMVIERSADDVWETIGDFGDLRWHPRVEGTTLDGDRRTTKNRGVDLRTVERLLSRDDAGRTFSYATVGVVGDSVMHLPDGRTFDVASLADRHRATITVVPLDDSRAQVIWEVVVDDDDDMTATIRGNYQAALETLKAELES